LDPLTVATEGRKNVFRLSQATIKKDNSKHNRRFGTGKIPANFPEKKEKLKGRFD
jgi:hypothetical protein